MVTTDDKPNDTPKRSKSKRTPALCFKTGEDVREARRRLGMNQVAFWGVLGVTQSAGSRYESGRNIPKPVQILLHVAYATERQTEVFLDHLRPNRSRD
ncbi:helix-turn-helix domain-containing protein [Thauera sinica]|uniref:helix-turn-helix domain-containing protein n=1 Tax=Thauera sp. K11 TaxID=2005884 RepID=UPI002695BBCA